MPTLLVESSLDRLRDVAVLSKEGGTMKILLAIDGSPGSEAAVAEVKKHIEAQTGKKVTLTALVDAKLIGGIVVQVEDKLFDASVAGKLGKLKNELLNSYISK